METRQCASTVILSLVLLLSMWLLNIDANNRFMRATANFSSTIKMTNVRTCREMYDHCYNDTIASDRGLQATNTSPSWMNDKQFFLSRCFCDAECHVYRDCCPDIMLPKIRAILKSDRTNQSTQLLEHENAPPQWKCQKFMLRNMLKRINVSVYMKSSCSSDWNDKTTENLCKRQVTTSLYDYTLDVPVFSNDTNVTYSNVYCAICNNDTVLTTWTISLHYPINYSHHNNNWTEWQYVPRRYHWRHLSDIRKPFITFEIDMQRSTYYETYEARQCKENVIDYCPSDWTHQKEIQMCSMYSLMVTSRSNNQTYKNKYCAICNGISKDQKLSCPTAKEFVPIYESVGVLATNSYSMLIDFMSNDDVGMTRNCGENKCGYGEICDALQSRCRTFTCGHRLRMNSDGQCVPLNDDQQSEDADYKLLPLRNCPRVFLYDDQFAFLEKDSIYVNETGKILKVDEYELFNDSVVLACANSKQDFKWQFSSAQKILSTVCVFISLICLAVHILANVIVPQLRNLPGKNLLSLSCSLFVAQFLFFFGLDLGENGSYFICVSVATLIHLCFLSSFFWMNIMAIDICRTFSSKSHLPCSSNSTKTYYKYSAYAWTTPLVIVFLSLANEFINFLPGYEPLYAQPVCWFNNRSALMLFFTIPLAALIVENIILFLMTVAGIRRTAKTTKIARKDSSGAHSGISSDKTRFVLYMKLVIIMGLTWTFGFLASLAKVEFLWYLFILFNALQGAFIFFAFTFKKTILSLVQERFSGKKRVRRSKTNSSNRTTTKSNMNLPQTSTSIVQDAVT